MSSIELNKYDNLIYLQPQYRPRDFLDHSLECAFSKLARIETGGTEENIPSKGKLVIGFLPHSGFLELALIDEILLRSGRSPAVWITKKENHALPGFLQSNRRLIYIDRGSPGPSSIRAINRVLNTPNGTIASALEGTRYSNPNDKDDVLTLGESLPGLMRFSYEFRTPIMGVVVLGVDKIFPSLDKIVRDKGMMETLKIFAKGLVSPKDVQMRFLPAYQEHLNEDGGGLKGKEKTDFIKRHNEKFTSQLIEKILTIDPKYPLGYYR
jgi:1-acyl-sn-glycerol-3-phosphate acyltransferase